MNPTQIMKNYTYLEAIHDLQSPIQSLSTLLNSMGSIPRAMKLPMHRILERIEYILRTVDNPTTNGPQRMSIYEIFTELVDEKKISNPCINVDFGKSMQAAKIISHIPEGELRRIFSNSIDFVLAESKAPSRLRLQLCKGKKSINIRIFSQQRLPSPNNYFYYALERVQFWHGSLQIQKNHIKENYLQIVLPSEKDPTNNRHNNCAHIDAVLIESNHLVKSMWTEAASQNAKQLICFSLIDDFLEFLPDCPRVVPLFIASDIVPPPSISKLIMHLYNLGFRNLYLTSQKSESIAKHWPWVKRALGKSPPWPIQMNKFLRQIAC